jgi:hypothetical protein
MRPRDSLSNFGGGSGVAMWASFFRDRAIHPQPLWT